MRGQGIDPIRDGVQSARAYRRFARLLDRLGGGLKVLCGQPVIDCFFQLIVRDEIFRSTALSNLHGLGLASGLFAQKIVEKMMIAKGDRALTQRHHKEIVIAQTLKHSGAIGAKGDRITGGGCQFPQHSRIA